MVPAGVCPPGGTKGSLDQVNREDDVTASHKGNTVQIYPAVVTSVH